MRMRETSPINSIHQAATRRRFMKSVLCSVPAFALAGPASAAPSVISALQVREHLAAMARQVELKRRFQWTGEPPRLDRLRAASAYSRLTVHHTGTSTNHHEDYVMVAADIENVMTGHRNRNFGDIGYHFIVDRAGRVWEGRSLQYIGAHVSAENEENIGIMLLGNFENQRPSLEQIQSLNKLTASLRTQFKIPRYRVYGHRDLGHTLCPGRYLYGYVGNMRNA